MPPLTDPFSADSATTDGFHFDYDIDRKQLLAAALLHVEAWLNDEIAALDPQLIGGTDLVAEAARWKQRFPHFRVRGTAIPRPNDPVPPDPLAVAIAAPDVDAPPTTNGAPPWTVPSSMLDWPAVAPALDWLLSSTQDAYDRWILLAQRNSVGDETRRVPLIELARGTDLTSLQLPDPPSPAFALLRAGGATLYFAPHTSTVTAYDLVQLLSSSSLTCCDLSLYELEPTWDPTSSPLTDAVAVPILGPAAGTDAVDLAHGTPPPSAEELERFKHHARHDSVASSLASADRLWSLSDELLSSLPDTWSSRGSWVHDDDDEDEVDQFAAIRTAEDSDTGDDDDDDDGWPRPGSLLTLNGTACAATARPAAAPRFPPRPSAPPPPPTPLAARSARLSSAHPRATTTGGRPARGTRLCACGPAARQGAVRVARARPAGVGGDGAADDGGRAFGATASGHGWVQAGIDSARAIGAGAGLARAGDGVAARSVGAPRSCGDERDGLEAGCWFARAAGRNGSGCAPRDD
ncbi:hypothetical protein GGF32_001647 [Allomyces javanicus]|nr:hypothetical protein GGF32_001647 [Allomyces javanicus]